MKNGWQKKRLGDVVTRLTNGYVGPTRNIYHESGVPYLLARHVKSNRLLFDGKTFISDEFNWKNKKSMLKAGDVLLVQSGHIGHSAVVTEEHDGHNCHAMIVISPVEDAITGPFLSLFFNSPDMQRKFEEIRSGSTVPHLTCGAVKELQVSLPPLPEQQRIVALLDEAFAGIAIAQANAEKNLQNARALFENLLQSVFTQRGEDWVERRLGELSRINYGYTESASVEKIGPHFLRITDIQDNQVDWKTVPYCPINADDLPKYKLSDGDFVFARTGATTGKSYLVTNPPEAVFASYLIRVQLINKGLLPQFLNLFFQTHAYWDTIRAGVSGSAQGGFNATKLGELAIPFPDSEKEQKQIVARLNGLSEETQRLANLYRQKFAALEALKKSLLHQAFSGELTEEPPQPFVIPGLPVIPNIKPIDLHAGILAIGYQAWEKADRQWNFGHVMAEKFSHMTEALAEIDLGRNPVQDHFGPDDFPHFHKLEHRARMANYFTFQDGKKGKVFVKSRGFDALVAKTRTALGDLSQKVDKVVKLMLPMDVEHAEVFATVWAAWNNLLMDGLIPTDERIVTAARENWHADKLKIPRENFFKTIDWIRKKNICPQGKGKKVTAKPGKK